MGVLQIAARKYFEASKKSPIDPLPLSNLSAALFEAGSYANCILPISKGLSPVGGDTEPLHAKLMDRLFKSYLYSKQIEKAQEACPKLNIDSANYSLLKAAIGQATATEGSEIESEKWTTVTNIPPHQPTL